MQYFQTEGFDTLGMVLPRALDISSSLLLVYIALPTLYAIAYFAFEMSAFEAIVHTLTTVSTVGFSTTDQSFAAFSGPLEYVSVIFMILGSLPFICYINLSRGDASPLINDTQVRAYIRWLT